MTDIDFESWLEEREKRYKEFERRRDLASRFRMNTPKVAPLWDTSTNSIEFNDIDSSIINSGINIWIAPFEHVWSGLYEPSIYDKETLWQDVHESIKIALVIDAWQEGKMLSPPFFVKHGAFDLGLVADGKHRLTVARFMGCEDLPFMTPAQNSSWVLNAIPSVRRIS